MAKQFSLDVGAKAEEKTALPRIYADFNRINTDKTLGGTATSEVAVNPTANPAATAPPRADTRA